MNNTPPHPLNVPEVWRSHRIPRGEPLHPESPRVDSLFLLSLFLLAAQGLLNYAFRGTPLIAWKQLLLVGLLLAALTLRSGYRNRVLVSCGIILPLILALFSYLQGIEPGKVAQDILYYIAWVPFYAFGIWWRHETLPSKLPRHALWFIIVSGVGLTIQLYTPYLNWLKDNAASLQYQALFSQARRLPLYFVASTIVMPTLVGFYCFICMQSRPRLQHILLPLPFLAAAALPTGALSAIECLIGAFVMAALTQSKVNARTVVTYAALGLIGYLLLALLAEHATGLTKIQLDRIVGNNIYSESNRGRLLQWSQALTTIGQFSPAEHIHGRGIGATHASRLGDQLLAHGESSFFQAYLEAGALGLLLRLMPFLLLLSGTASGLRRAPVLAYGGATFIACAVAPVFGAFGIQCTLGLIAGLVNRRTERS